MWGTLQIISALKPQLAHLSKQRLLVLNDAPSINEIEHKLGGPVQEIHSFDSILHGGEIRPCIVFALQDAKRRELPPNAWANMLWLQALVRKHGFSSPEANHPDYLAGPVGILLGDEEFMDALSPLPS